MRDVLGAAARSWASSTNRNRAIDRLCRRSAAEARAVCHHPIELLGPTDVANGESPGDSADDDREWAGLVTGDGSAGDDSDGRAEDGIAQPVAIRRQPRNRDVRGEGVSGNGISPPKVALERGGERKRV